MKITQMQTTAPTMRPDGAVLNSTALVPGETLTSIAIADKAFVSVGKNGPYLTVHLRDEFGVIVKGRMFNPEHEAIFRNWETYRSHVIVVTYEVQLIFNGEISLNITKITGVTPEQEVILKKDVFKLVDPNTDIAISDIASAIKNCIQDETMQDTLLSILNSSTAQAYLRGGTDGILDGRLGGNAILFNYLVQVITNLPGCVNSSVKGSLLSILFIAELAIYSQAMEERVLSRKVYSVVNKLINNFKTQLSIDEDILEDYISRRLATAELPMGDISYGELLYNAYKTAISAFKITSRKNVSIYA